MASPSKKASGKRPRDEITALREEVERLKETVELILQRQHEDHMDHMHLFEKLGAVLTDDEIKEEDEGEKPVVSEEEGDDEEDKEIEDKEMEDLEEEEEESNDEESDEDTGEKGDESDGDDDSSTDAPTDN